LDTILSVKDLRLSINTGDSYLPILKAVDFELKKTEILGLVGPSGSGKSMTLKSIIRLFEQLEAKVSGQINFIGSNESKDVLTMSSDELRELRKYKISYLFQQSTNVLNPGMRIIDQITENYHGSKDPIPIAKQFLEQFKLTHVDNIAHAYPHQLSGGQIQRVLLAMSVINGPQILLADEPTSSIDKENEEILVDLLVKARDERQLSIILVSHDLELVERVCDRYLLIE